MNAKWVSTTAAVALVAAAGGCAMVEQARDSQQVTLMGSNEVPAVNTRASGKATVTVAADCSVTANITVAEMFPTAAHIHEGAPGANGGVAVPLTKTSDNSFATASGAKFTAAQCDAYKKGNTYINVHSNAHPNGEIRGQLRGR